MRPRGQIFDLNRFTEDHNLTQRQVAEDVKRPQSFLSAIAHGKRSIPPDLLDELCHLYQVDNISEYLSDRKPENSNNMQNIRNSIVNSPGGSVLVTEIGGKITDKNLHQILKAQEKFREEIAKEEPPPQKEDGNVVLRFLSLLEAANEKNKAQEIRIKELEKEVEDLKSKLPKRMK